MRPRCARLRGYRNRVHRLSHSLRHWPYMFMTDTTDCVASQDAGPAGGEPMLGLHGHPSLILQGRAWSAPRDLDGRYGPT